MKATKGQGNTDSPCPPPFMNFFIDQTLSLEYFGSIEMIDTTREWKFFKLLPASASANSHFFLFYCAGLFQRKQINEKNIRGGGEHEFWALCGPYYKCPIAAPGSWSAVLQILA